MVYGIGTAVPVVAFAMLIAFASRYVGKAFNAMAKIERWFRLGTGIVFLAAGLYYILKYTYGVSLLS